MPNKEEMIIETANTATEVAKTATDKTGIIFMIGGVFLGALGTVGVIEGTKVIKKKVSEKKSKKAAKKAEKAE